MTIYWILWDNKIEKLTNRQTDRKSLAEKSSSAWSWAWSCFLWSFRADMYRTVCKLTGLGSALSQIKYTSNVSLKSILRQIKVIKLKGAQKILWRNDSGRIKSWGAIFLVWIALYPVPSLHCTAPYCTVLYCTVLHCAVLHCTALHCTVLCCTELYWTALHCTALYCTAPEYTQY